MITFLFLVNERYSVLGITSADQRYWQNEGSDSDNDTVTDHSLLFKFKPNSNGKQ